MLQGNNFSRNSLRRWLLPLLAGVSVLAIAILLARSLQLTERNHVRHMTKMATTAIKADIEADLDTHFLSPVRTASLWDFSPTLGQAAWDKAARVFLSEHPKIFAVARVSPDGQVWSIPESFGPQLAEGLPTPAVNVAKLYPSRDPHFSGAFADEQGERFRRVLLTMPGENGRPAYGMVAFREREVLDNLLSDVTGLGYSFTVAEGQQEIFSHRESSSATAYVPVATADVAAAGLYWKLTVVPGAAVIADLRSMLPGFVLATGAILGFLLGATVFFAQATRRKNTKLVKEIGERQKYEMALQASEARLNGILDTSVDGVVAVDEQQRIRLFNKGAENIFGYRAEEVLGESLGMLIPPRFQRPHENHVDEFGASAKQGHRRMAGPREVFGRKKDGTEFPIEASISKLATSEGTIYTSIVRDVADRVRAREELKRAHEQLEQRVQERTAELATANEQLRREIIERHQAEMKLRLSEGRMEAILDNCTASIFMKDLEGRVLLINRWYETLFGVRREEIVGKTDFDFLPHEVAARFRHDDEAVIRTESPIEFEETITHPDGSRHTYVAAKFLVRDENGKPYAICGIATDITRQKQTEELLRELSGGLMAMQDEERKRLSRELHEGTAQMLAAVQMNLEVAKSLARDSSQKVVSALDVSLELVEQSASELRTMAYLLHPPGLDDFGLASALRWYANGFSTHSGIKVEVDVATEDTRFSRDIEMAVFRIVQEALTNILRHSGSRVARIALREQNDELELEVSDSGHGMMSDVMERMSSGKTVPGIGIAGIRERVRQLGGVFGLHSGPDGVRLVAKLPSTSSRETKSAVATLNQ
jgi:PAS domain S-box-containing protein